MNESWGRRVRRRVLLLQQRQQLKYEKEKKAEQRSGLFRQHSGVRISS